MFFLIQTFHLEFQGFTLNLVDITVSTINNCRYQLFPVQLSWSAVIVYKIFCLLSFLLRGKKKRAGDLDRE